MNVQDIDNLISALKAHKRELSRGDLGSKIQTLDDMVYLAARTLPRVPLLRCLHKLGVIETSQVLREGNRELSCQLEQVKQQIAQALATRGGAGRA